MEEDDMLYLELLMNNSKKRCSKSAVNLPKLANNLSDKDNRIRFLIFFNTSRWMIDYIS